MSHASAHTYHAAPGATTHTVTVSVQAICSISYTLALAGIVTIESHDADGSFVSRYHLPSATDRVEHFDPPIRMEGGYTVRITAAQSITTLSLSYIGGGALTAIGHSA